MNNLTELDVLYSPSRWSKRLSADEICVKHVEILKERSECVRSQVPNELDIPYGEGDRQKYDLYGTDLNDGAPILIYLHGGYWQETPITHSIQGYIAENLYKNQIKSMFIGYELCPKFTVGHITKTIETAFGKCLNYAKKHKSRGIFLCGHSAGAQLAAMLFTSYIPNLPQEDQALIKSVYLLAGVYDLIPLVQTIYNELLHFDDDSAREASPYYKAIAPKSGSCFYVVAAEFDSPIFKRQSKNYFDKLVEWGVEAQFVICGGVDHFDLVEKLSEEQFELTKLIIGTINC